MSRSRTRFAGVVLVAAAAGVTACAAIIGLDEGNPRGGSDGSDGGPPGASSGNSGSDEASVLATYGAVSDPNRWELFDLTTLNAPGSQASVGTFNGALFDGHRVTFVPYGGCASGTVAMFDPVQPFAAAASWSLFDLRTIQDTAHGFVGGAFDGARIHLAPNCNSGAANIGDGTAALHDALAAPDAGWSFLSVAPAAGSGGLLGLEGYQGAVFDGQYVYYAPTRSGQIVRYDPQPSHAASPFATFDAQTLMPPAAAFTGAVFDGQYVYFVPGGPACSSVVARLDTHGDVANAASWSSFDLKTIDPANAASWCRYGGVFDGRTLTLVPYDSPLVVRFDIARAFAAAASWAVFDLRALDPLATQFAGGAFDGRYVYLVPGTASKHPAVVFRVDSLGIFTDNAAWSSFDLATKNPNVDGFVGAALDGRWIYLAPAGPKMIAARFDARSPTGLPSTYRGSFL